MSRIKVGILNLKTSKTDERYNLFHTWNFCVFWMIELGV